MFGSEAALLDEAFVLEFAQCVREDLIAAPSQEGLEVAVSVARGADKDVQDLGLEGTSGGVDLVRQPPFQEGLGRREEGISGRRLH